MFRLIQRQRSHTLANLLSRYLRYFLGLKGLI
jgi:hypothetical protein